MGDLIIKSWGIANWNEPSFEVESGPQNPTDFWFDLRIDVGESDKVEVSSYQMFVCTPLGLMSNFAKLARETDGRENPSDQYILGKGLLIVREYNIDIILEAVNKVLARLDEYAFNVT
jgi:hypothetical protein